MAGIDLPENNTKLIAAIRGKLQEGKGFRIEITHEHSYRTAIEAAPGDIHIIYDDQHNFINYLVR